MYTQKNIQEIEQRLTDWFAEGHSNFHYPHNLNILLKDSLVNSQVVLDILNQWFDNGFLTREKQSATMSAFLFKLTKKGFDYLQSI